MENNANSLIRHFSRLIMQLQKLEKQPRVFGDAGPLTPSEIHTVEAIGSEGGVPMSELADRLQITKGAVTQMVSRLEDKRMVRRGPNPNDSRSVIVGLTDKGKTALQIHDRLHMDFYKELGAHLNEQERSILEHALEKLCTHLQKQE